MDDNRWRRLRPALETLLGLPAGERRSELARIADGDAELASELHELLRLEEAPGLESLDPPSGPRLPWLRPGPEDR